MTTSSVYNTTTAKLHATGDYQTVILYAIYGLTWYPLSV